MIQFDSNRFGKLAMWSLRNDRSYYVRSFLQIFAVQTLMFLFFTTGVLRINNNSGIFPDNLSYRSINNVL